jgi:hypothetical protein
MPNNSAQLPNAKYTSITVAQCEWSAAALLEPTIDKELRGFRRNLAMENLGDVGVRIDRRWQGSNRSREAL